MSLQAAHSQGLIDDEMVLSCSTTLETAIAWIFIVACEMGSKRVRIKWKIFLGCFKDKRCY